MKFNFIRFILFLALPVLIIGAIMFGVKILESYGEKGAYLIPEQPVAHESAKFSYQLMNPATNQPLSDATVQLTIAKTKTLNPWFYVGYLREDNKGTGIIYQMDYLLNNGMIQYESTIWDAGSYSITIHATSPHLKNPLDITVPMEVKVPLDQILRTIFLFLFIFIAAVISGYIGGSLQNPFKKTAFSGKLPSQAFMLILFISVLLLSTSSIVQAHEMDKMNPISAVKIEKDGIIGEFTMNPTEPVQKGKPVAYSISFHNEKGESIKDIDANLSMYHVTDNISMFSTHTQIPDGHLQFNYAFPDTADYRLSVHATPSSLHSNLPSPFDGDFSFEVPPVQPSLSAQLRAGTLMLIVTILGLFTGIFSAKRKKVLLA